MRTSSRIKNYKSFKFRLIEYGKLHGGGWYFGIKLPLSVESYGLDFYRFDQMRRFRGYLTWWVIPCIKGHTYGKNWKPGRYAKEHRLRIKWWPEEISPIENKVDELFA